MGNWRCGTRDSSCRIIGHARPSYDLHACSDNGEDVHRPSVLSVGIANASVHVVPEPRGPSITGQGTITKVPSIDVLILESLSNTMHPLWPGRALYGALE